MLRRCIAMIVVAFLCFPVSAQSLTEWVSRNSHNKLTPSQSRPFVEAAFKYSIKHGVDPFLILAVMKKESGFRVKATSSEGAKGPMQVIAFWHKEKIRGRNLQNIDTGVDVGTMVLAEYLEENNGNTFKALKKYSGGSPEYARSVMKIRAKILNETGRDKVILAEFVKTVDN